MSDRREDDLAAQAWPGFVDILSSTVIMFVFFVLIVVVVLFLFTIKFTSTVKSQAEQSVRDAIEQAYNPETIDSQIKEKLDELTALEDKKQATQNEVDALQKELGVLKQMSVSPFSSEGSQRMREDEDGNILIFFDDNAAMIEQDVVGRLVDTLKSKSPTAKIEINVADDPQAAVKSLSRQINLARMMNVRNILMEQGYDARDIGLNYVDTNEIDGNLHWVHIIFDK